VRTRAKESLQIYLPFERRRALKRKRSCRHHYTRVTIILSLQADPVITICASLLLSPSSHVLLSGCQDPGPKHRTVTSRESLQTRRENRQNGSYSEASLHSTCISNPSRTIQLPPPRRVQNNGLCRHTSLTSHPLHIRFEDPVPVGR